MMLLWSVMALMTVTSGMAQSEIRVQPEKVLAHLSRTMTGACIEDVNHEQYGGIYTQMVFGESFQEPPVTEPPVGFVSSEGAWVLGEDGSLLGGPGAGPRLMREGEAWSDGAAGVEVYFDEVASGNAGLILRVRGTGRGADAFAGYEVSLDQAAGVLLIGRHEFNWQPLVQVPLAIPAGRWIPITVRLSGANLSVEVDGRHVVTCQDPQPLAPGVLGIRPWQRMARFRGLWEERDGQRQALAFAPREGAGERTLVSNMWRVVRQGEAQGTAALTAERPFVGRQSQALTMTAGPGRWGIENRGLNRQGMAFVGGCEYEGCLWARADADVVLTVALESGDGSRTLARQDVVVRAGDWTRHDFTLRPGSDETGGRLAITLREPGSVTLGYVALEPGEWGRYKGLASRRDVAEGLVNGGLTVLRNGGCMVNTDAYRWQQMIGPRDRRQPYTGFWYTWSSNGWGIVDFMQLCEAAGFECIPAVNLGETPESLAALVQYANAPVDSEWGARRAADGHPAPYVLRYLQLGNEEAVDESYWQHFAPQAEAIWAVDPDITLVVGDFAYNEPISDPLNVTGAPRITTLETQRKILELAAAHGREVWFDVHVWSEFPQQIGGLDTLPSVVRALRGLCPEARFKLAVLELNSNRHDLGRALANARSIGFLERMGDDVRVVCSANCLQTDGQNDNGWDQGLLFLNPEKVWAQPPLLAAGMISRNWLPLCVEAQVTGAPTLDVTAKRSDDGRTLQLQVVNWGEGDVDARLDLGGFVPQGDSAEVETLAGPLDLTNTAAEPERVTTRRETVDLGSGELRYRFAKHSFTVLRCQR